MSVKIEVSIKNSEQNYPELIKIASVVREALRAEGLFDGTDIGKSTRFGKGYCFIFKTKQFHMIDRKMIINQKEKEKTI